MRPMGTPRGSDDGCVGQGGGRVVLIGDGRRRWSDENGPTRQRSKAVAELRWPGRASLSPAVGGGDMGGEAWSKRDERRGMTEHTEGGGWRMARRRQFGRPAWTRGWGKRGGGATECSTRAREGG
jgi:hypothetical protein